MFNTNAMETWTFRMMVIAVLVVLLNHVAVAEDMSSANIASTSFVMALMVAFASVVFCRQNAATSPVRRFWGWAGVVAALICLVPLGLATPVDASLWLVSTVALSTYSLLEGYSGEFNRFAEDRLVPWIRRVTGDESTKWGL